MAAPASIFAGVAPVYLTFEKALHYLEAGLRHKPQSQQWEELKEAFKLTAPQMQAAYMGFLKKCNCEAGRDGPVRELDVVRLKTEFHKDVLKHRWGTSNEPQHERALRQRATSAYAKKAIEWVIEALNDDDSYREPAKLTKRPWNLMKQKISLLEQQEQLVKQQLITLQQEQEMHRVELEQATRKATEAANATEAVRAQLQRAQQERQAALSSSNQMVAQVQQHLQALGSSMQQLTRERDTLKQKLDEERARVDQYTQSERAYLEEIGRLKEEEAQRQAERERLIEDVTAAYTVARHNEQVAHMASFLVGNSVSQLEQRLASSPARHALPAAANCYPPGSVVPIPMAILPPAAQSDASVASTSKVELMDEDEDF